MTTPQLKPSKILLIGDSCVDEYFFCEVNRISPEAPVPIANISHIESKKGMAGNVFSNLRSLGNKVTFLTNSQPLRKTRIVDYKTKQQLLRIDSEREIDSLDISLQDYTFFDAIVVSDYDKGFISLNSLLDIVNHAQALQIPLFIDSKKTDLSGVKHCFIKVNKSEYESLSSVPKDNEFIVTLGEEGALWRDKKIPTKKRSVFDVCGAGDTFLAALVSSYLSCGDIIKSIEFANECASMAVTKFGCYSVSLEDLK